VLQFFFRNNVIYSPIIRSYFNAAKRSLRIAVMSMCSASSVNICRVACGQLSEG